MTLTRHISVDEHAEQVGGRRMAVEVVERRAGAIGLRAQVDEDGARDETGRPRAKEEDIVGREEHVAMDVGGATRDAARVDERQVERMGRDEVNGGIATGQTRADDRHGGGGQAKEIVRMEGRRNGREATDASPDRG